MSEEKRLQEELELGKKLEKEFAEDPKQKLVEEKEAYEAKVAKAIAKFPERKEVEGQRIYTPLDVQDFDVIFQKLDG